MEILDSWQTKDSNIDTYLTSICKLPEVSGKFGKLPGLRYLSSYLSTEILR